MNSVEMVERMILTLTSGEFWGSNKRIEKDVVSANVPTRFSVDDRSNFVKLEALLVAIYED